MKIIYITFALLFSVSVHANVRIQLFYDGAMTTSLSLPDNSRLSDLLHDERLPSDIYWRSAQLTNQARTTDDNSEKALLINELTALKAYWQDAKENELAASVQKLIDDVTAISVSGRFNLEIAPELSLIGMTHNPLLKGDYVLYVAARKPWLHLVGLTASDNRQGLYPGVGVDQYWQGYHFLAGADPAFAYLIQPTGEIALVPVAMWNKKHREPMAGATIFIGFDPDIIPDEYKNINKRIANVIANRIPQ